MEALIFDIENELRFISKEIDALKRKKDILRAYRHKLRRIYTYLIAPEKVVRLTETALKSFDLFYKDWEGLKKCLLERI